MINRLLLLAGPLALLAGCVETRLPVTEGRISTAAEFETTVVNREFIAPDERLAILPRGRFSGQDRSSSFAGRWTFQDGQLCLTRTAPAQGTARCRVITVDGNFFTLADPTGAAPTRGYRVLFLLPPSFEQRQQDGVH